MDVSPLILRLAVLESAGRLYDQSQSDEGLDHFPRGNARMSTIGIIGSDLDALKHIQAA